jgi:hypothetical protein
MRDSSKMASQTNEQKDESQGATESGEKLKPEMKSRSPGWSAPVTRALAVIDGAHRPNFWTTQPSSARIRGFSGLRSRPLSKKWGSGGGAFLQVKGAQAHPHLLWIGNTAEPPPLFRTCMFKEIEKSRRSCH